ncbi:hypothetical protein SY2F82_25140 [Streptomyces sp. Y2F8-2]|nr:hypothetical protein SY2F82_25140 [Streptomyces sp. Y2F8-2]
MAAVRSPVVRPVAKGGRIQEDRLQEDRIREDRIQGDCAQAARIQGDRIPCSVVVLLDGG